MLLEPISCFVTSYQFIQAAKNVGERKVRICTLAAFLSTSLETAIQTDPSTNTALGAIIASKISYIKAILARRGGKKLIKLVYSSALKKAYVLDLVKISIFNVHEYQYNNNSKIIIKNMFREHENNRYCLACAKGTYFSPRYSAPVLLTKITKITKNNNFTDYRIIIIILLSLTLLYIYITT